MTGRHRAPRGASRSFTRIIDGRQVRMLPGITTTCAWLGEGFCAASVEGYCLGGHHDNDGIRQCHG